MMEIVLMKNVVARKLRLGMKLRSGCMRLLGRLVSRSGARVRWVNLGMLVVEGASFRLLVRMRLRGWSRIEGDKGFGCEGFYVPGNRRYGATCIRSSITGVYAESDRGVCMPMCEIMGMEDV